MCVCVCVHACVCSQASRAVKFDCFHPGGFGGQREDRSGFSDRKEGGGFGDRKGGGGFGGSREDGGGYGKREGGFSSRGADTQDRGFK